jgi:non-homologous end joining protein Ku
MGKFFQETIDNHRATFDPSNIRDLVDMYLAEIQRAKEEGTGEALFEGKDHGEPKWQLNTELIETSERRCLEHQGKITNESMDKKARFECSELFDDEV